MINGNFVLSGGGARGFAHLGIINVLNNWDIRVNAISGVSAGALMAAFLCDGFHPLEIKEIFLKNKLRKIPKINGLNTGLFSLNNLQKLLKNNLRHQKIEQLEMPLYVTVTNLQDGNVKVFSEGNCIEIVIASCAVPGFFSPVEIGGIPYADGGILCNFPADVFDNSTLPIIGISVNPPFPYAEANGLFHNLDRTINIMLREMSLQQMKKCKVLFEPPELSKYHVFQNEKVDEIFALGKTFIEKRYSKENLHQKLI